MTGVENQRQASVTVTLAEGSRYAVQAVIYTGDLRDNFEILARSDPVNGRDKRSVRALIDTVKHDVVTIELCPDLAEGDG